MFKLQINQCDEILLRIQVPDTISRAPRTLLEFDKWKGKLHLWLLLLPIIKERNFLGSQLREWVLFFSLPVLTGKLPGEYLKHFSLLIASLHILLADTISPIDLDNVQGYLKEFYMKLPQLYGM